MKNTLIKLNMIKNHNQMIRLENEIQKKDYKILKMKEDYKDLLINYQKETNSTIERLEDEIKKINDENTSLKQENNYYKASLEKIPKFLLRIFIKKDYFLLGNMNDERRKK